MSQMNYRVVRPHSGDRDYAEGDIRTASPQDVGHLVPNVLELLGPAPKPKPKRAAKAVTAAPKNKALPGADANKSKG